MSVHLVRAALLVVGGIIGYAFGSHLNQLGLSGPLSLYGMGGGAGLAIVIILLERSLRRLSLRAVIGGSIGLLVGVILASLLNRAFLQIPSGDPVFGVLVRGLMNAVFGYMGIVLGVKKGEAFDVSDILNVFRGPRSNGHYKILDTSVIIDGRIADICETGFLEGTLVIPQFILKELQHIADSSDSVKRNRGRRGLEILHRIQRSVDVNAIITDQDFPKIKEVDAKLIALGKMYGGKILTNDFNLNKVAQLQGIQVLNVNELANAVKPVVLPGEGLSVYLLKEGKEYGQGVAYLDDGTMVVVDNARRYIGNTVEVLVTSVLQTTTGRMIFTRLREDVEKEEQVRTGGAPRAV